MWTYDPHLPERLRYAIRDLITQRSLSMSPANIRVFCVLELSGAGPVNWTITTEYCDILSVAQRYVTCKCGNDNPRKMIGRTGCDNFQIRS